MTSTDGRGRGDGVFRASREDVRLALEAENIEARPVWKPMHRQPVYRGYEAVGGAVAERLFERGLCLPSQTMPHLRPPPLSASASADPSCGASTSGPRPSRRWGCERLLALI